MRKLRFAVILPVVQLIIALALFKWGERQWEGKGLFVPTGRLLCHALNAPALLFLRLLDLFPDWSAPRICGFYFDEIFFLPGVAVVWYLVGRALDRRVTPHAQSQSRKTIPKALFNLFLVVYGVYFFWTETVTWFWHRNLLIFRGAHAYDAALYWAWSVVLILAGAVNLVKAIRPRLSSSSSQRGM
jgi:amino acid transporter